MAPIQNFAATSQPNSALISGITASTFSHLHELTDELHLDARHALWMPRERVLVVADLHLGYVWAHRHAGQMMPISVPDDTVERLAALVEEYRPAQVVLLGDIVHRAVPVPVLREELGGLIERLSGVRIRWVAGNHDRGLGKLQGALGFGGIALEPHVALEGHHLTHGAEDEDAAAALASRMAESAGWLIMGHEHPAISLHDHVTTSVKFPCFLAGERILVLPAFSRWSAGANVRSGQFLSAFAKGAGFTHAYAVMRGRVLRVPL